MKIKDLRTSLGLSQSKFGLKFNIGVGTIQHWEQGISTPPDYVITMIQTIIEQEQEIEKLKAEK